MTLALRWKICIDQDFLYRGTSLFNPRRTCRKNCRSFYKTGNYNSSQDLQNDLSCSGRRSSSSSAVGQNLPSSTALLCVLCGAFGIFAVTASTFHREDRYEFANVAKSRKLFMVRPRSLGVGRRPTTDDDFHLRFITSNFGSVISSIA